MSSAQQLKEYERLFAQAQGYDPARFSNEFERAYGEATNYNKDLIEDRSAAVGQMQALPGQLREQYYNSPVRNPLAQESLIGTRKANISSNIGTLTDLLTARRGRYEDVLGKQLAAYQSDAQRAQQAAENQWRLYQDALDRERAAAQNNNNGALTIEDIMKLLTPTGEDGGGGGGGDEIVIDTGGVGGFLDNQFAKDGLFGSDLTTKPSSFWAGVNKYNPMQFLNPMTYVKSGAGLIGNYIGNKNQKDKNFFQKLFNTR